MTRPQLGEFQVAIGDPFISNTDTLHGFAGAIKAKADAQIDEGKNRYVSMNESEVRALLSTEDLSEEQIQKVVSDLR